MKPDHSKLWYFTVNGRQCGPVPYDELVRMAELGVIDRMSDKVWCDGMADWVLISELESVYDTPPPIPQQGLSTPSRPKIKKTKLLPLFIACYIFHALLLAACGIYWWECSLE